MRTFEIAGDGVDVREIGKMHGSIGGIIEGIFTLKGYGIVRSSTENRLIIAVKQGGMLAIGYSDPEVPATPGEIEMFQSMAESEGAQERMFISPARIGRDMLIMLKDKGIDVWDRTAFVLAIGETALRNAVLNESLEEWEPLDEEPGLTDAPDRSEDVDPVAELRRYQEEIEAATSEFRIRKVDIQRKPDQNIAGPTRPTFNEVKVRKTVVRLDGVSEAGSSSIDKAHAEEIPLTKTFNEGQNVQDESQKVFKAEVCHAAPLKVSRDQALEMAPGSISDLALVLRPFVFMSVEYDLREVGGPAADRRSASMMIDLVDGSVMDIPPSVLEDLSPCDRKEGKNIEEPALDEMQALERCMDWIGKNDRRLERKIHDGMMSTIYSELEAAIDRRTVKVMVKKGMVMPVWKGKLALDGSTWLIDGYAGTQRRGS